MFQIELYLQAWDDDAMLYVME